MKKITINNKKSRLCIRHTVGSIQRGTNQNTRQRRNEPLRAVPERARMSEGVTTRLGGALASSLPFINIMIIMLERASSWMLALTRAVPAAAA